MSEVFTQSAPSGTELQSRLLQNLDATQLPSIESLLDLNHSQVEEISRERQKQRQGIPEWGLWNTLFETVRNDRAALAYKTGWGTSRVANQLLSEVITPALPAGMNVLVCFSCEPASALWECVPDDYHTLVFPHPSFRDHTPRLDSSWSAVSCDNVVVAHQRSHVIIINENVCLHSNPATDRLSAAQAADRAQQLQKILTLMSNTPRRTEESNSNQQNKQSWISALEHAESLTKETSEQFNQLTSECRQAQRRYQQAEVNCERTRASLEAANAELKILDSQMSVVPVFQEAAIATIASQRLEVQKQIQKIKGLPQIADVEVTANEVTVTTKPLVVDCGDQGLRNLEPITFTIYLDARFPTFTCSDTPFHPKMSSDQSLDWGETVLPLTERLGAGEYAAAVLIICGQLSARCVDAVHAGAFRRSRRKRPGFVL